MAKCAHGVYLPSDTQGNESPYCGFCTPLKPIKLPKRSRFRDELGWKCPLCMSDEFEWTSDDKFTCPRCGFDQDFMGDFFD